MDSTRPNRRQLCEHCGKMVSRVTYARHQQNPSIKPRDSADGPCSVEGCEERCEAKGYCPRHYRRFLLYGDPLGQAYGPPDAPARDDCGRLIPPPVRRGGARRDDSCIVEDCMERARSRGMCDKHHKRWLNHGDPLGGKRFHGTGTITHGYHAVTKDHDTTLVHRRVIEEGIGRPLYAKEIVHHRDGNPLNNEPSNLQITTRQEHRKLHQAMKTHCKHGHEYTPENTYVDRDGNRECRACRRQQRENFYRLHHR